MTFDQKRGYFREKFCVSMVNYASSIVYHSGLSNSCPIHCLLRYILLPSKLQVTNRYANCLTLWRFNWLQSVLIPTGKLDWIQFHVQIVNPHKFLILPSFSNICLQSSKLTFAIFPSTVWLSIKRSKTWLPSSLSWLSIALELALLLRICKLEPSYLI